MSIPIVTAFHVRSDDWVLPLKMDISLRYSDLVVVLLDRPTVDVATYIHSYVNNAKVAAYSYMNTLDLPDEGPDGPICEEGRMYRRQYELAREAMSARGHDTFWLIQCDADEVPTPELIGLLDWGVPLFEGVPCAQCIETKVAHLWETPDQYIAGPDCIWSPEHPDSNWKGVVLLQQPGDDYTWPDMYRHCPNTPENAEVRQLPCIGVHHYKWVGEGMDRWDASNQAKLEKYQRFFDGMQLKPTPKEALWS